MTNEWVTPEQLRKQAAWIHGPSAHMLADAADRIEALERWRTAIIDAAVVDWVYTKEHESDPRKAVNDLLCWQQKITLDPAVSREAKALHDRIAELERENICDACAGTGKALSGECMCGGTGEMSKAAIYLRERVFELERELAEAKRTIEEYRRTIGRGDWERP